VNELLTLGKPREQPAPVTKVNAGLDWAGPPPPRTAAAPPAAEDDDELCLAEVPAEPLRSGLANEASLPNPREGAYTPDGDAWVEGGIPRETPRELIRLVVDQVPLGEKVQASSNATSCTCETAAIPSLRVRGALSESSDRSETLMLQHTCTLILP
jgi:hypothetical protein